MFVTAMCIATVLVVAVAHLVSAEVTEVVRRLIALAALRVGTVVPMVRVEVVVDVPMDVATAVAPRA